MDRSKSRRTSAPASTISSSSSSLSTSSSSSKLEAIHPYRSLRIEKRNRITKEPEVSIILEANESELTEDKIISSSNNNYNNKNPKDIYSRSNSHASSIKSNEKFDVHEKQTTIHQEQRLSRMSNGSSLTINSSNHSINNFLYDNKGFTGSTHNINRSTSTIQSSAVIREQYWSCPKCCCRNWTRREKILIWIVTCLVLIICGLFTVVGFLIENNGNKAGSRTLYSWKL